MLRALKICLLTLPFLSLPLVAEATGATPDRLADHVVLVSIDGLRPEFYLEPTWPAPMLQHMAQTGSHAEAVSGVFPSVTYPSHTSMITGALPSRHGIYYNSPFELDGQTGRWYWDAELIQVPTLWTATRDAGLTSGSLSWPVSVGASVDWLVPEIWPLEPTDPIEYTRDRSTPGLVAEIEREATGRLTVDNFTIDHITREDRAGAAAAYLLAAKKPNLLLVHLIATDHFQHEDGRDSLKVRLSVAAVDRALAQMVEAAERSGIADRTAFVITGDHGHVALHTKLAPNVWLRDAGLVEAREDRSRGDWRAAFHTTGSSAFLHLRDPQDETAVELARRALDALPPGVRSLFRIVERPELEALGADPNALFALNPVPGVNFTSSANDPAVRPDSGATHGYIPDFPHIQTGLVAAGAGIRSGGRAAQLRLTDVAPLVAHLLGLDFEAPDGSAPWGFIADSEADH